FQAEDGIRDFHVTGVQTCALPISLILVGQRFRDDALVRANAHIALLWGGGCLFGPLVTGAASRWASSHALPVLMAAMAVVFLILAFRRGAFDAVRVQR